MSLYDRAYRAANRITSDTNGWGVPIVLTDLSGNSCNIIGTRSKHHLGVDNQGNSVNTKNAHVSFHELQVINAGFNIRNGEHEIAIKGWQVDVGDSSGNVTAYSITEFYPSETIGLIVCVLAEKDAAIGIGQAMIEYTLEVA